MNCISCNHKQRHLVKDLYLCEDCGLVSSDIVPDLTLYDKLYAVQYFRHSQTDIGERIQDLRHNFVKLHMDSGSLLDFGCGYGNFIDTCNSNGIRAAGFDINPHSKFCSVASLLQRYNAVTFWDSIEHLENPIPIIQGLCPKWVFISTPSIEDFTGDLTQLPEWHHYKPAEHIHYFSLVSLTAMLNVSGYMVIDHHYDESKYRISGGGNKNILTIGAKRVG